MELWNDLQAYKSQNRTDQICLKFLNFSGCLSLLLMGGGVKSTPKITEKVNCWVFCMIKYNKNFRFYMGV